MSFCQCSDWAIASLRAGGGNETLARETCGAFAGLAPGMTRRNLSEPTMWTYSRHKSALRRRFGISIVDYEFMESSQKNKCAICGGSQVKGRRLCVDHCHSSYRIRGLLCDRCNQGIGNFKDNPETLKRAAAYLESRSTAALIIGSMIQSEE